MSKAVLGSYQYPKWGAICSVRVFPMEVTRLVPEGEWEERHRGRRWVSPEKAAQQLMQPELQSMVLKLTEVLQKG